MTSFAVRMLPQHAGGVHQRVQVFAGPDEQHRVLVGELTMAAEEAADLLLVTKWPGMSCCDLHGPYCEPPSELCCRWCTEAAHPEHRDGNPCVMDREGIGKG